MRIAKPLRDNAALVAGIVLPVIVVALFLLSSWIPKLLVDPPQYDFLYVEEGTYYGNSSPWRYDITLDGESHLLLKAFAVEPNAYPPSARLFLFEHTDGNVREISLPAPSSTEGGEDGVVVELPEFRNQHIDPRHIAPDGYSLVDNARRSRGLFGLFSGSSSRGFAISKNGAVFKASDGHGQSWYGNRFIGWLVPSPQQ